MYGACGCACVRVLLQCQEKLGSWKNQKHYINYGSDVGEKWLITDITYFETSVCLCRDFDMALAIFSPFFGHPGYFLLLNPVLAICFFSKISSRLPPP